MNCEEYEILLSARLDGALTPEETARLEAHLAQCPQCRQLAQELETLQAQTAALTQEVPRALQENLEGRDWSRVPQTGTAPSKKKKRLLPWAACAAAAVVLMVFGFTHLALPGGSSGLSEGFAALFSLPGGPGGEHRHRRGQHPVRRPRGGGLRPDRRRHPSG